MSCPLHNIRVPRKSLSKPYALDLSMCSRRGCILRCFTPSAFLPVFVQVLAQNVFIDADFPFHFWSDSPFSWRSQMCRSWETTRFLEEMLAPSSSRLWMENVEVTLYSQWKKGKKSVLILSKGLPSAVGEGRSTAGL